MITSQAQRLYGRARLAALGVEVAVVRACWVQGKPLECSVVAALEYLEPPRSLLLPCSQAVLLMISNPAFTFRTLNYGKYGILLILW